MMKATLHAMMNPMMNAGNEECMGGLGGRGRLILVNVFLYP